MVPSWIDLPRMHHNRITPWPLSTDYRGKPVREALGWPPKCVSVTVGLENRFALEEMRRHRRELRNEIRVRSGQEFDFGLSLRTIEEDLSAIEDGIKRLQS